MVDFDTNLQPQTQQARATSGSSQPAPAKRVASIKLFFDENLTKKQIADEFGQVGLDLFNVANSDGDDVISQKEYDNYIAQQTKPEDLQGKSGKRSAPGGVYTVQKGDTLSIIADDFGTDVYTLYKNNKSTIGSNKNLIKVGQKLSINASVTLDDPQQVSNDKNEAVKGKELVLSDRAKKALSDEFGKDITNLSGKELAQKASNIKINQLSKALNIVMENSTKDDLKNFTSALTNNKTAGFAIVTMAKKLNDPQKSKEFISDLSNAIGEDVSELSVAELMQKIETLDKSQRKSLYKNVLLKDLGDNEVTHPELKSKSDITKKDFDNLYGIDSDAIKNEKDPEKRKNMLARCVANKIKADRNLNDESSFIRQALNDINNGNLTEAEKLAYGSDVSKFSDKLKLKIAEQRIHNAHTNVFADTMLEAMDLDDYKEFCEMVEVYVKEDVQASFDKDTTENGKIAKLVALAADDEKTPAEYQTRMTNILSTQSEALGVDNLDDDNFSIVTMSVYKYADEESINTYNSNNSERADLISEVAQSVLATTSDSTRISIIEKVVSSLLDVTSTEGDGNKPATASGVTWSNDPRTGEVNERKNNYNEYYSEEQSNYVEDPQLKAKDEFFTSIVTSLSTPEVKQSNGEKSIEHVKKAMEKAKNMDMAGALSFMLKECPPEFMPVFEARIRGIAKPILVDAYVNGDDNLRKLLKSLQQIHTPDIIAYFDNKPSELNNVSIQVKFEYMKAKSEEWSQMSAIEKSKQDVESLPYPMRKIID